MSGILPISQYTFLFVLAFNPPLFKLFEKRHFLFLAVGILLAFINHRAVMPFMLLILLDLDYSKLEKKDVMNIITFFALQVWVILTFGSV